MVNSGVTIIVSLAFTIVTHAGRYAEQSLISRLFVGPPILCLPQLAGTGVSICQCWVIWSTNTCSFGLKMTRKRELVRVDDINYAQRPLVCK